MFIIAGRFFSFFLWALIQYIQQGLIFLAALRTYIQVLAEDRHNFGRILLVHFALDVFIQPCIQVVTGDFLDRHAIQDMHDSQYGFLGEFLLQAKAVTYPSDNIWYVHILRFRWLTKC